MGKPVWVDGVFVWEEGGLRQLFSEKSALATLSLSFQLQHPFPHWLPHSLMYWNCCQKLNKEQLCVNSEHQQLFWTKSLTSGCDIKCWQLYKDILTLHNHLLEERRRRRRRRKEEEEEGGFGEVEDWCSRWWLGCCSTRSVCRNLGLPTSGSTASTGTTHIFGLIETDRRTSKLSLRENGWFWQFWTFLTQLC